MQVRRHEAYEQVLRGEGLVETARQGPESAHCAWAVGSEGGETWMETDSKRSWSSGENSYALMLGTPVRLKPTCLTVGDTATLEK